MTSEPNYDEFERILRDGADGKFAVIAFQKYRRGVDADEELNKLMEMMWPQMEAVGARIVWAGRPEFMLLGERRFDAVIVAEYPNARAFMKMISQPEWAPVEELRLSALEDNLVYAGPPVVNAIRYQ